jgi:hypothetical protein
MIRLQSHIFWLLVLVGHAALAAVWWWLMPHGFPISNTRFWVNEALPWLTIVAVVAVIVAAQRERLVPARGTLLVIAAMWITAGVYGRGVFPVSFGMKWLLLVGLGGMFALATRDEALLPARMNKAATVGFLLAGVLLGGWLVRAQRSPDPSTHPIEIATPAELPAVEPGDPMPRSQFLRGGDVKPSDGVLSMQRGPYVFGLLPLLNFTSRSEDRCWTCLMPAERRIPVERTLTGFARVEGGVDLAYKDLGRSWLSVRDSPDAGFITLEAISKLSEQVFSHLNQSCQFQFAGHRDLELIFSTSPEQNIALTHFDYPIGDPARFAYFEGGALRVCEAASGEKGPYKTLAQGKIARGDPLTITLVDQNVKILRVTLFDFTEEASTALSPTAGWGVSQNAIEFSLDTADKSSTAVFFVTLAGTSVGRGWDSVGHAAGTYRNRMKIEWVDAEEAFGTAATTPSTTSK